jgi:hypothetical protein
MHCGTRERFMLAEFAETGAENSADDKMLYLVKAVKIGLVLACVVRYSREDAKSAKMSH